MQNHRHAHRYLHHLRTERITESRYPSQDNEQTPLLTAQKSAATSTWNVKTCCATPETVRH
jgi:hypothetical protein